MKTEIYKYVRVLKNGHRVSSYISGRLIQLSGNAPYKYKVLTYSTKRHTAAPKGNRTWDTTFSTGKDIGIFCTNVPKIQTGNVCYSIWSGTVELWLVSAKEPMYEGTYGKVKLLKKITGMQV